MEKQKLVYEIGWLIDRVYRESDRISSKVIDTSRFEERCINDLGEYLSKSDDNKRHKRYLNYIIKRYADEALNSYKKEIADTYTEFSKGNEESEEEIIFEPVDVLADVESEVRTKETIALLAQDDRRKKMILGSWTDGNDNNSKISSLLAETLGGNTESHRKYIQRFRAECREILSTAI